MEVGKLEAIFTANTQDLDSKLKASEERIKALRANIASIKTDDIGFKSQRIEGLKSTLSKALADHKSLQAAQKATAKSAQDMSRDMGSALSSISPRLSALAGAAGPLALVAGSLVAIGAAAAGLYQLITTTAVATGKFTDLSQQTGFAVETLSTLSNAAHRSGGDINTISAALGIFESHMVEARTKGSEMSSIFKQLSIDTTDNEKALRQAIASLAKYTNEEDRSAAARRLFGRSARDVLAIIKDSGSNIDELTEKMRKQNTLITTESSRAADALVDKMYDVGEQFAGVGRIIAEQFYPAMFKSLTSFENLMVENIPTIRSWVSEITSAVNGTIALASGLVRLTGAITGLSSIPIPAILKALSAVTGIGGTIGFLQSIGGTQTPTPAGGSQYGAWHKWPTAPGPRLRLGGGGGGGGGGRGGGGTDPAIEAKRMAELQLRIVLDGLQAESSANKRSLDLRREDFNTYATQYMSIEAKRHDAVVKGLDAEEKAASKLKKGQAVALQEIANKRVQENTTHEQNRNKVLDERGAILDRMNAFMAEQDKQVTAVTFETDHWEKSIEDLVEALKLEGVEIEGNMLRQMKETAQIGRDTEARKRQLEVIKEGATRLRRAVFATGNETRPRIATDALLLERAQERFDKMREEMMGLGQDLTSVFSRSIGDGFDQGAKHGLATLAQGLLDIVENIFLKKMAEGLGNLLTDFMGGGKGGGWLGKLLGIGLGAAAGGAGGGGTSGGGGWFAKGGYLQPGQWGMAGEHGPEPIYGGKTGMTVIPNQSQPIINNYTIQLPPVPKGGYSSPKSQRQMAEHLMAALQGART